MNPHQAQHPVRIRRRIKESRYFHKKGVYKYYRYYLTIPTKYKDLIEIFMGKDLHVEAKQVGDNLIIEATPTGTPL
jgi:hypothetical protein